MLHIITSRHNNLWNLAAEKLRESYQQGRQVLLLVPEQYTLQAERDSMTALGTKGFFRLQVLSPSRLQKRVFDQLGKDRRIPIDDRGKMMTMARVLWQNKDLFVYYGSAGEQIGFTHKLVQAVSELKGAGVHPQALLDYAGQEEGIPPRISDLARIYQEYEVLLTGQLADQEDEARDMLHRLAESSLFFDFQVVVYGFDLITEPLIRLLGVLGKQAHDVMVLTVSDGKDAPDADAFTSVHNSIQRLKEACQHLGISQTWQFYRQPISIKPPALQHLSSHLLRLKPDVYPLPCDGLRLYAGRTAHEEIRQAAQLIHQNLLSGVQPRDIAVILAQDSYALHIPGVFSDYQIPYYLAAKEPLLSQPLIRCVLDALRIIQAAVWRTEDVLRFARNPFSPLSREEVWDLHNYALAKGIGGSKWTKPFTKGEEAVVRQIETLRKKLTAPVVRLRDGLVQARNAHQSIAAVLGFLDDLQAQDAAQQRQTWLYQQGMQEEAIREGQVWEKLMQLLSQMLALWGEDRIPLGRFPAWMEQGISMTELSALPPQENCVQIGIMGQLMPKSPSHVYLLGLNNGVLSLSSDALIADEDRIRLEQGMGLKLNLKLPDRESVKQLDLWKALTAAHNFLWISYALGGDDGSSLAPLSHIGRIQRMFPQLVEEGGAVSSLREPWPFSPAVALDELATLLYQGTLEKTWSTAFAWLRQHPNWQHQAQAVYHQARGDNPYMQLRPQQAQALFPPKTSSVSRLETFAGCPFRHFVSYGLRPLERAEWKLEANDLGTAAHNAMEHFTRAARQDPAWPNIPKEASDQMMNYVLSSLTQDWENAPWADTHRAKAHTRRFLDLCRNMAWALTQAGQVSGFQPVYSELSFGMGGDIPALVIPLESGDTLFLRGTIDRLDVGSIEGISLVRVIDYKTGNQDLQAGDVQAGVQLQLLLYLQAARSMFKHLKPAGAFYQRLENPIVRADSEEKAVKEQRRRLRLNGVVLADADVLSIMDQGKPPLTLPKYIKNDGSLPQNNRLLSQTQLTDLLDFTQQKAADIAHQIVSGTISRSPLVKTSGRTECGFCPFEGVCRRGKINQEQLLRHVNRTARFSDLNNKNKNLSDAEP